MMGADADADRLLELYKLHADLADRVSQRREGANRLYVSVLAGMVAFLTVSIRIGVEGLLSDLVLVLTGIFGAVLSVSWCVVIRSYRQLNSGKFAVLQELEKRLAYPFFTKESEKLKTKGYRRLTVVETALPAIFFALFVGIAVSSFAVDSPADARCETGVEAR